MLSLRIALRYLFSKKSHRAVNIISAISIAGVAVATMAIVVVLSVFNGFSGLSASQLSRIDAAIRVEPREGKTIAGADSLASEFMKLSGVSSAQPVIEERAMLVSGRARVPVAFKAVQPDYRRVVDLDSVIIDGLFLNSYDSVACMQLSVGVANRTGLRPGLNSMAELYVPRRKGRINPANPAASLRSERMLITGVLEVERADVDNDRVIIPIESARRLLDYDDEATAIELSLADGSDPAEVMKAVSAIAGDRFNVLDRHMQQADAFRMIAVEKWITFMMLVFILVIASFNIISTLSLLVVEKRHDMGVLRAMGASRKSVRSIFAWQGFMITLLGGVTGIVIGIILSLVQEHFGLIRLAGDPAALTISVYPVAVEFLDVVIVLIAVMVIGSVCSQITRLFTKNIK